MKSTEVYKIARPVIAPWCKQNGFKRTAGGMLGWVKPVGKDDSLVFWLQCSQSGWDAYAGSSFCVEFQRSASSEIGGGSRFKGDLRELLPYFLTVDELEEVRQMQNRVISKLERPPANHFAYQLPENTLKWYLGKFNAVETAYTNGHDVWFRYHDVEDVILWAEFVAKRLPRIISRMESPSA